MAEPDRDPDYNSGDDFVMEYGDYVFAFSEVDFTQRTERAARSLELVSAPLNEDEMQDLVEFMVNDKISSPRSPLAEHIDDNHEILVRDKRNDGNVVKWLRRVVFSQAMLDQDLLQGRLDVEFDEKTGDFKYVFPDSRQEVQLRPQPSWRDLAYKPGK